jgi:hypothetical protein
MGEVQSPSTACYNDGLSVSTALAGLLVASCPVWARDGFAASVASSAVLRRV